MKRASKKTGYGKISQTFLICPLCVNQLHMPDIASMKFTQEKQMSQLRGGEYFASNEPIRGREHVTN